MSFDATPTTPRACGDELDALFSPSVCRLIRLLEANLFVLAKEIETEEQAKALRALVQRPVGVLNSRFGMRSNASNKLSAGRK
jgi:hypothetical protein